MRKLIPIILICLGIGGGVAAGMVLRPDPPPQTLDEAEAEASEAPVPQLPDDAPRVIVEFPNQFMVPIVAEDRVAAVMLIGLALEVDGARREMVTDNLLRLRDALLQVLFDHSDAGGFAGAFTSQASLGPLRRGLLEAAQNTLGRDVVTAILITEIMRTGG